MSKSSNNATNQGISPENLAARTVYIAGAGIAGMTLALALAKFNIKVVVLEKTGDLQTQGAGLQVSPNARRVLDQLGLDAPLSRDGFIPDAIDIYPFRRPKPLMSLKLGQTAENRFGTPYMVIHRADLANALFDACKRFANIEFQFGITNFDMQTHANGLSLSIEHSDGQVHNVRPFAFVGADGVHSPTRTKILNGPQAKYSGYVAWRALIPASMMKGQLNLDHTSLLWAPGFHAVAYPHPNRHVINIALFTKEKLTSDTKTKLVLTPTIPETVFNCSRIQAILDSAESGWQKWPLYAASTPEWHKGPIGLIGDAAHAMLPYQAQGAAMAIEDAAILAPLLARTSNATTAFEQYTTLRKNRVNKVVKLSASNGRIYHMQWPFTIARDLVVALQGPTAHLDRLAWIYSYDAALQTHTTTNFS